jgi:uncharacterized membrane protein
VQRSFAARVGCAIASRWRLFTSLACGLVAWGVMPGGPTGETRAVLAWDLGVVIYLGLAISLFTTERAERMEADAEAQQEGEWTIFALTLAAVAFSFAAIISAFANIKDLPPQRKSLQVGLVAATLLLSWLMTHTTFAFRYAHEYYAREGAAAEIDGGLDFPGNARPDYLDFVYFSLVLGMTFQVSDVQITSRKLRRVATVHGLLSFLFNTIVLALTVNLAAGLL